MIKITCCSTVDLPKNFIDKLGVEILPFHYYVNGKEYLDDMYSSITPKEFFDIASKEEVTTSQPSPEQSEKLWTKILEEGNDVIHISLSSGISGAYNSSVITKNLLKEKFPERKIAIIDSLKASHGYGLLVYKAVEIIKQQNDFDKIIEEIEDYKLHLQSYFYSQNLAQYVKGGRISRIEGTIGSILNICPYMFVTKDGKLKVIGKARGKKKVREILIELIKKNVKDGENYTGIFSIGHSDIEDEAVIIRDLLKQNFPKANFTDFPIFSVGPTIGSHTGRGTIDIHYECTERA